MSWDDVTCLRWGNFRFLPWCISSSSGAIYYSNLPPLKSYYCLALVSKFEIYETVTISVHKMLSNVIWFTRPTTKTLAASLLKLVKTFNYSFRSLTQCYVWNHISDFKCKKVRGWQHCDNSPRVSSIPFIFLSDVNTNETYFHELFVQLHRPIVL